MTRKGSDPEPAPPPDHPNFEGSIQQLAIMDVLAMDSGLSVPSPTPTLAEILRERADFGREKYGTYLSPRDNGRRPVIDMLDEILDLVAYTKRARVLGTPGVTQRLYHTVIGLAQDIHGIATTDYVREANEELSVQLEAATACIEKLSEQNALLEDELFKLRGE